MPPLLPLVEICHKVYAISGEVEVFERLQDLVPLVLDLDVVVFSARDGLAVNQVHTRHHNHWLIVWRGRGREEEEGGGRWRGRGGGGEEEGREGEGGEGEEEGGEEEGREEEDGGRGGGRRRKCFSVEIQPLHYEPIFEQSSNTS